MKKNVVNPPDRIRHALINLSSPARLGRVQDDLLIHVLNHTNDGQSWKSSAVKGHSMPRRYIVPQNHELDEVATLSEVGSNIDGIIVPDERAATSWTDGNAHPIDEQFVSRVRRAVNRYAPRETAQAELAFEPDDAAGRVDGRVDPIWWPDPIGLKLVDCLQLLVSTELGCAQVVKRTCCSV